MSPPILQGATIPHCFQNMVWTFQCDSQGPTTWQQRVFQTLQALSFQHKPYAQLMWFQNLLISNQDAASYRILYPSFLAQLIFHASSDHYSEVRPLYTRAFPLYNSHHIHHL